MTFQDKVIYQIYPKSFCDSNQDGWGDLNGIIGKLDYLETLGVDYIWLTPFMPSPQRDNGYDVADYCAIDPRYGTMDDFKRLVKACQEHHIDIMLDMVFNHTSTSHIWFQKALQGDPYYQDFYIIKKGRGNNPPTNWISKFGGSAWEYVTKWDAYYLHLFDVTQADLNWENPHVREALRDVVRFWMDLGVKGFRFDVVNLISKGAYEDDLEGDGRRYYTDGPHVHEYLRWLNENSFGRQADILTVGEMSSTTLEQCQRYARSGGHELNMVFHFQHLKVDYPQGQKWALMPFDFLKLKEIFNTWQLGMQASEAWDALFWNNHDQPRALSRFGDDRNHWYASATMLATVLHGLRGTPYIYQGEEIGMTNPHFAAISQFRDVESLNYFDILKADGKSEAEALAILNERSRDLSRTPMQWEAGRNAGFSEGTPWMEVNENASWLNAQAQLSNPDSVFHYYRKLIALRKQYPIIQKGRFEPLYEKHPALFAYARHLDGRTLYVLGNFYDRPVTIEQEDFLGATILIGNGQAHLSQKTLRLEGYGAIMLLK